MQRDRHRAQTAGRLLRKGALLDGLLVFLQRDAGMGFFIVPDLVRCTHEHDFSAGFAAFGAEVDDPVACCDHIEVVLDHKQRMPRFHQAPERTQQFRDVLKVQTGRWLVEQEQRALGARRMWGCGQPRGFSQMACELQALRFAAGQSRHRLAEAQVFEADFGERTQGAQYVWIGGEIVDGFGNRHVEHIGDALCRFSLGRNRDFEEFRAIAPPVAIGTTQIDIGQELHFDVFEPVAAAGRTTTVTRIEAEHAGLVGTLFRHRRFREQVADRVEGANVTCRIGTCRAADRRLIDHDHVPDQVRTVQRLVRPCRFGGFALVFEQPWIQYVLHQRRFARSRDAGHAHQPVERDGDVDILQVVLGRTEDFQARIFRFYRKMLESRIGAAPSGQVFTGQ